MGTIQQERVSQQRLERVSIREREWKNKASWSNNRLNVASNKMGKRQSQRKSQPPQYTFPSQEINNEKKLQQRKKHKPSTSSTKRTKCRHSAQRTSESKSDLLSPAEDRKEPKVQTAAQSCGHREQKHTGFRAGRHTPAFPCHRLSDSSPDLTERRSSKMEVGTWGSHGEGDSDSDLSESERLPLSPSVRVPPQLKLRPEDINAEDNAAQRHRTRAQGCDIYDFPDFLPPPFNSWNLRQLAVFYNVEVRGAPRPRPVGSLERYLERLLQVEWHQIQTVQEESGKSPMSDITHSCHRTAAATSSRLSSPKCILQCQRAFPLTFLSSLISHSALLSGCACTLCCIRYSTSSTSCCRSNHSRTRHSRTSPILERRDPVSLPKRSYSETRVHSFDRSSESQTFSSPVRANSHLQRMRASGNMRNPVQGANIKPQSTARDLSIQPPRDCLEAGGNLTRGVRIRSGSEQRGSGVERQENRTERKRSSSEYRRRGTERRRTAEFKEIKPDAVTAIMDNLPASKYSTVRRPNRQKQVEFIT